MNCPITTLESLGACNGYQVGLGTTVKIALPADLTTTPLLPALPITGSALTNEAAATGTGTYTAASTGKGFVTFEIDDTAKDYEYKASQVESGAWEGMMKGTLSASVDALGFCRKLPTRSKILVLLDKPDGSFIQLGLKSFAVVVKKWEVEESNKSAKITFEFEFTTPPMYLPKTTVIPAQA